MLTASGKSLKDVVAKGCNQMSKLVEIVKRWLMRRIAFHTDVRKMYNSVKLNESDWVYQLCLWEENLDPHKEPVDKAIKTAIYGVKSSGNQPEHGLRQTAQLQKEEYSRVHEIVKCDVYIDDCMSGEDSVDDAHQSADQLEIVIARGGYILKGFTFSGKTPLSDLSSDGESINVAGMRWYPESDLIQLDASEINFAKKNRGKLSSHTMEVPAKLTKRLCAGLVAKCFDITGIITPITAGLKIDLHEFPKRGVQWDDVIPDDLRGVWKSNFLMMQEISTMRFKRTIIPEDAASLQIDTIDTGDASKSIACVAIYARLKRQNGEFSCQLVFARSKLIEEGTTQPRAELIVAMLDAHTGEVVRRAFGKFHKKQ